MNRSREFHCIAFAVDVHVHDVRCFSYDVVMQGVMSIPNRSASHHRTDLAFNEHEISHDLRLISHLKRKSSP
jgi:hypothetical protein